MKKYHLLLPLAGLLALASCDFDSVKGDGHVVSKSFGLSGFSGVETDGIVKVYLQQAPRYSVKVDAEQNILAQMDLHLEGQKLDIDFKDKVSISPTRDIKVYLTAPEFRSLEGSGACSFFSEGALKSDGLKIELSGASNADLEVAVQALKVEASGASELKLKGSTTHLSIDGSGSVHASCFGLAAEHTKVDISGAGSAEVNAGSTLEADINGAGSVRYKGSPATIKKEISGAGSVSKAD